MVFFTDQCISIESLNVQKQLQPDRKVEGIIVVLSVEEIAIARQVKATERRATMRCPEYDNDNIFLEQIELSVQASSRHNE